MPIRDRLNPTPDEMRQWASDPESQCPHQEWDLYLVWQIEDGGLLPTVVRLADDPSLPKSGFFLLVLYQWVDRAIQSKDFEDRRQHCDWMLDSLHGLQTPAVKRWRYRARLFFQKQDTFERESWWADIQPNEPTEG